MARFKERERALALRQKEMSYSQIKEILHISKSTLSTWLKNYPLSEERIKLLRDNNQRRIERCRETKKRKKEERLDNFYKEQKKSNLPLSNRELYLAGLFLYWGEGAKTRIAELSVSNTDPVVIKFFLLWFTDSLSFPKQKIRIGLHLYADMNIEEEIKFWSDFLTIPTTQFYKPYVKNVDSNSITHKGGFGHGTCNIRVLDARLSERILMGLKAIRDSF